MDPNKTCVVIPSIREFDWELFENVSNAAKIFVIDDSQNPDRIADRPWKNIEFIPSAKYHVPNLMPIRSPACKNIGLWLAWQQKYDYVVLLDDDCDTRICDNFIERCPIGEELSAVPAKLYGMVNSKVIWANPMEVYHSDNLFSRGFPYNYMERRLEEEQPFETIDIKPMFNQGLWWGCPDDNGINKLVRTEETGDYMLQGKITDVSAIYAPQPGYFPLSIMNVQIHRDLIPAFWQPPNYKVGGIAIKRHDDVWSGLLVQTVCKLMGYNYSFGGPMIYHTKIAEPFKEMRAEFLLEQTTNVIVRVLRVAAETIYPGIREDNTVAEVVVKLTSVAKSIAKETESSGFLAYIDPAINFFDGAQRWAVKTMEA